MGPVNEMYAMYRKQHIKRCSRAIQSSEKITRRTIPGAVLSKSVETRRVFGTVLSSFDVNNIGDSFNDKPDCPDMGYTTLPTH